MRTTLETVSGLYFDFEAPRPEQVKVDDVALALSKICRFGGHCARFYSVAEHAVLVASLVEDPALRLAALHHDSHEAYLGDIPTPLKRLLGEKYEELRAAADVAIGEALRIDPALFKHPDVHDADALALRIEARELKHSRGAGLGIGPPTTARLPWWLGLSPNNAEKWFTCDHYAYARVTA